MKGKATLRSFRPFGLLVAAFLATFLANSQTQPASSSQDENAKPISTDQIGAVATKQYEGDGLSVTATPDGARLRCAFQRLEGEVTSEGLWLSSTVGNSSDARFRVLAVEVGRAEAFGVRRHSAASTSLFEVEWWTDAVANSKSGVALRFPPQSTTFWPGGVVSVDGQTVRFIRDGLTEEYSVSVDGVRQDFVVEQRPEGAGELRLELEVTGATVEPLVNGAQLTLNGTGRRIAYSRLRVTDARGQELTASMELTGASQLAVVVDDAPAVYPVTVDPTFSDADWTSMGGLPGTDGSVNAMAVNDAGNLYIGGNFLVAGGNITANRVAKWDGASWSAMGTGVDSTVLALAALGTNLYAGGNFTNAGGITVNRIAKWDGVSWSALGTGMDHNVRALAVSGANLYAGGTFTNAGGLTVNRIAKWDGAAWSALGVGMNGGVYALAISGTDLYAGGFFFIAGGINAQRVARWDGTTWSALGTGVNGLVAALAVSGPDLYVGGDFAAAGTIPASYVAKWDGSGWSNLGAGLDSRVYALAVSSSNVYVGGQFTMAGGLAATNMARWDGAAWQPVSAGLGKYFFTDQVNALAMLGTNLFAGGTFTNAGIETVNRVTKLDDNVWLPLATGLNGSVAALAISGTNLYAGGHFTAAGGNAVNYIAQWNGSRWSGLGRGMNSSVLALALLGNDLYAAGRFTNAGGVVANRIAKWDGNEWFPLGSGLNSNVFALAVSETNLYVGGSFTVAGGVPAKYVARWDGNAWATLGTGFPNPSGWPCTVYALIASGSNLYGGCGLTVSGGPWQIPPGYVALWNGTTWTQIGQFPNSQFPPVTVLALAVSGTNLYAGGYLLNGVMKWTGTSWISVGLMPPVYALAISGTNLYAGGSFTTVGGVGIAKWNGLAWSPLGSGVAGHGMALATTGTALYVGGSFTNAGGKVSLNLARATIDAARGRFTNLTYSPPSGFGFAFVDGTVGQLYRIQTSSSLGADSWVDLTNFTYTAQVVINDPVTGATNRFYRAVTP